MEFFEHGIKYELGNSDYGQTIELFDGDKQCAKMMLSLINDQINLSSVECKCAKLRGRCFNLFMQILVKERDQLFKKKLSPATEVALFISPEYRDGVSEKDAFEKLQKLYGSYGFLSYDKKNKPYAVSTLNLIEQVVNNNLVIIDDPNITPIKLYARTPEPPKKLKNSKIYEQLHRINLDSIFNGSLRNKTPRYMLPTESSRSKSVKGRGKKRQQKLSGKKLSGRQHKLSGKKLTKRRFTKSI